MDNSKAFENQVSEDTVGEKNPHVLLKKLEAQFRDWAREDLAKMVVDNWNKPWTKEERSI